jgi:hypothetical protein
MRASQNTLKNLATGCIALAMLASGWAGMVLCVGADGHFAFELPHEGHCQDAEDAHHHHENHNPEQASAEHSACQTDCVDVALSSDTLSRLVKDCGIQSLLEGAAFQPLLVKSAALFCAHIELREAATSGGSPPSLRLSPNLLAKRTTVLRV